MTLIPDEIYEEVLDQLEIDRGMRRLGWLTSPTRPNYHLEVRTEEGIAKAASSLAAAAFFFWHLDPVATAAQLQKVAGEDDNGGEWD